MAEPEPKEASGSDGKRNTGPGWLLSAYTLGSGTAVGSLWAGAKYGYDLVWVQPLAMLMGVIILSGAAYFSLQSEASPYQRFRKDLGLTMALAWALASLFASVIWHFPQYGLAFSALKELLGFEETAVARGVVGISIFLVSTAITWGYVRRGGVVIYETIIKLLVWMVIVCLGVVILASRVPWHEVGQSLVSFRRPEGSNTIIFGLLGAAVGINMTFLYPYSVRAKGWGREGTKLAIRDLILGMFLPFVCATGMMLVASAAMLHAGGVELDKSRITEMARVFTPVFGGRLGPMLFDLGILAMPLTTITLHMLTCGFIVSEMTGKPERSWTWRLGTLIPAVGAFGVAVPLKGWLPVTASAVCLIFLPIAYVGFVILFVKDARKPDSPRVPALPVVIALMLAVIVVVSISAVLKSVDAVRDLAHYLH